MEYGEAEYGEQYAASGLLDDGAAGHGNIGQSDELRPGHETTLIQLTGDDWTAQQVTVCIVGPEPVTTGELVRDSESVPGAHVVAIATWGVGGLRARAEIDCVRGATFSVPASSLVVVARHSLPQGRGPIYRVGAFVGYAPRPGSSAPQRTLYGASTDTEALALDVPAFATSVRALRVEGAVAYALSFMGLADERLAEVVVGETEQPPLVPIPNGAVRVRVASVRPSSFALVFGLAL